MSNKRSLILLNIGVSLFVLFILIRIFVLAGGNFSATVVPKMISDDYFYYARIQEIGDGNPFLGNPFYLEHSTDPNSTFVLPDWIASIPYILGIPVFYSFAINILIWAILFSCAVYYFFKVLNISSRVGLFMSGLLFLSLLTLIMRPTIMQVIYPFFILGLVVFYHWLSHKPKKYLLFITILLLSFSLYFYQHLAFMLYFLSGVTGLYFLFRKRFKIMWQLAATVIASVIISIPILKYYFVLSRDAVFKELLLRIDDAFSREPSFFVFMAGKWVVIAILLWTLIYNISKDYQEKKVSKFFIIFGVATILASMANVITGVRVEIAEHVYRFQEIYISMSVFISSLYLIRNWREYWPKKRFILSVASLLLLVVFFTYFSIARRSFVGVFSSAGQIREIQAYRIVFEELNKLPDKSVVWADQKISFLLPVYTNHYTLFARDGSAYLVSNDEIQERYLLDHVFDNTQPDLEENIGTLIGYGNEFDFYKEHNRWVGFCNRYYLSSLGFACGQEKNTLERVDDDFFVYINQKYNDIKLEPKKYLDKYYVDYWVIDRQFDDRWEDLQPIDYFFEIVYADKRFEIYKLIK